MASLPECPGSLKSLQHYLKTAVEHDARDPVVAYWCRLHALQLGMKLTSKKTPEETKLLMALMGWLEEHKKTHRDNEAISNDVAAQAHLDNYALKLFLYADKQDREQNYTKNVVKAFYTSGMIYDVLTEFGELSEEASQNRKYAKWKAAYIHNCLKNDETPVPGPMPSDNENPETSEDSEQPTTNDTPTSGPYPPAAGFVPNPTAYVPAPSNFSSPLPDASAANQPPTVPYTLDPNTGFHPYSPVPNTPAPAPAASVSSSNVKLTKDQVTKALKYCKWANSALNYEDAPTAITNLKNALQLLETGHDPA